MNRIYARAGVVKAAWSPQARAAAIAARKAHAGHKDGDWSAGEIPNNKEMVRVSEKHLHRYEIPSTAIGKVKSSWDDGRKHLIDVDFGEHGSHTMEDHHVDVQKNREASKAMDANINLESIYARAGENR